MDFTETGHCPDWTERSLGGRKRAYESDNRLKGRPFSGPWVGDLESEGSETLDLMEDLFTSQLRRGP